MDQGPRIRNLGILAHVDAGKTTLTERMLFLSGNIRSAGSVDKGTALSDAMDVEKRRGISVKASALSFPWRDVQINLIDTPGHVDFSAEVERSLRILDCAVLVLSAVEGIQTHTELIWHALEALDIPVLLFVNKIDRVGADAAGVLSALRREFSPEMVLLNCPVEEGDASASVSDLLPEQQADALEMIASKNDALLERYLNEETIAPSDLADALSASTRTRQLFPVVCGAAKTGIGVDRVLDGIVDWLPDSDRPTDGPVSGVVYRVEQDARFGRLAGVRMYSGTIRTRDTVPNTTADREEKITQIKKLALHRLEDAESLAAGEIGFFCGMPEAKIGDILGTPEPIPGNYTLSEPLLSVQVKPTNEADLTALTDALQQLSGEDPHLDLRWFAEERELLVRIMGPIQVEILTEILRTRFGLEAEFGSPTVVYRETPAKAGYGQESYTMPKPCWAIVKYLLEPGARGSGFTFTSQVGVNDIKQKYQNEIAAEIPEALKQGIKGWEVTDLKITLVEGSDHVLHSRPGNFPLATNIALLKGLTETGSTLLEPILRFRITAPEEFVGKVTADIIQMRGTFDPVEMAEGRFTLRGRFPLATSMDYPIRLSSLTSGRGHLSSSFDTYEACPEGQGVVREYRGICPLDRSKYILKMRGAITTSAKRGQ